MSPRGWVRHCGSGLLVAAAIGACAPVVPHELADARQTYDRARSGPAAEKAPAQLYQAARALAEANDSFGDQGDTQRTRDLAYIADRRARLAEAQAVVEDAHARKADAEQRMQRRTSGELAQTRERLSKAELGAARATVELAGEREALAQSNSDLLDERQARVEAERKAQEAMTKLEQIASVKEQERGLVITFPGSVLFAFDQAVLLPGALSGLDQVAEALSHRKENILVEGHTDARGTDAYNYDLSYRRAQAVRDYLIARGLPPERVRAVGAGESRPVADNRTSEGRANNRRVEIVVERARSSAAR
jgi:outer membrane protein OmpA-like peptidoglycan-associated protein